MFNRIQTKFALIGAVAVTAAAAVVVGTAADADPTPTVDVFGNIGVLAKGETTGVRSGSALQVSEARANVDKALEHGLDSSKLGAKTLAARNQDIRTVAVQAQEKVTADISSDGGQLCWRAMRSDGTQISADACWTEPFTNERIGRFVTRASDGYRVILLVPDSVKSATVTTASGTATGIATDNVIVVATAAAAPKSLTWTDASGVKHDRTFDKYDLPGIAVPDGFVPPVTPAG